MAPTQLLPSALVCALFAAGRASAHGIATAMVHWPSGTFYAGYDPSYQYARPPPTVIGWSIPNDLTNTFVSPKDYATPDIICHIGATPAGAEAPVTAGDVLEIQWNKWPASHKGPVLDYLANCHGPCESADKTKLKFFKIDEAGLLDAATDSWAANELLANNLSWSVRLPTDIAPGNYILRHEMIALHAAGNSNGAQNYPFCFNLAISSDGTKDPDGIPATEFYKSNDPGILYDLFTKHTTYVIPGPTLYTGALSVAQSKPGPIKATSSGVASYVAVARQTEAAGGGAAAAAATEASAPSLSAASKPALPSTLATVARATSATAAKTPALGVGSQRTMSSPARAQTPNPRLTPTRHAHAPVITTAVMMRA